MQRWTPKPRLLIRAKINTFFQLELCKNENWGVLRSFSRSRSTILPLICESYFCGFAVLTHSTHRHHHPALYLYRRHKASERERENIRAWLKIWLISCYRGAWHRSFIGAKSGHKLWFRRVLKSNLLLHQDFDVFLWSWISEMKKSRPLRFIQPLQSLSETHILLSLKVLELIFIQILAKAFRYRCTSRVPKPTNQFHRQQTTALIKLEGFS